MSSLGELIKARREEMALSLREFAEKCDMSHSYIRNLEDGDPRTGKPVVPRLEYLEKLAPILDMSLENLLIEIGYIEETDKKFEPSNLKLIRGNKPYKQVCDEIFEQTGERIEPSVYEAFEKGVGKKPSALFIDMLAKFTGVNRSFFYQKNTRDVLEYAKLKAPYQYKERRNESFNHLDDEIRKFISNPDSVEYLILAKELYDKKIKVKFIREFIFED